MPIHTAHPLAYFITFHTYGTWLPGDPRGTVDTLHRARGLPYAPPSPSRQAAATATLRHPPVELYPEERGVVLQTIQEVCRVRGWALYAVHVRVNHVHVVIGAEPTPERVMNDLKAWSTRRLVEAGHRPRGGSVWVRHGSTRHLWKPEVVQAACVYVMEGQGEDVRWAVMGEL
jgi:REP element-mobilizing transposase RayT